MKQPARELVAQIIVKRAGKPDACGSGYHVAPGWVLTAYHVVSGAIQIGVWSGAPQELRTGEGVGVDPHSVLSDPYADLALLPVGTAYQVSGEHALLGRLDREAATPVPVVAAGFPRFKLRGAQRGGLDMIRELHEARGTIAAGSNAKTRTYEFAGLIVVPDEDPEPRLHSPWEGMSGAAVWGDGRLVGVVAEHHASEGRGTLTVRPIEELFRSSAGEPLKRWRAALGSRLPARPEDLWLVTRRNVGDISLERAHEVAAALAPAVLEGRENELAYLDAFASSEQQWCWVQGAAYAGKTALLAWFSVRPPSTVALVSCFLRSTTGANTAEYALETLNGQLAAVANQTDYQPPRFLPEKQSDLPKLMANAARACTERGRRLLIVVDGLDEYDSTVDSLHCDWLPAAASLPIGAALLVASRSDAHVDVPREHPLQAHVCEITASDAAADIVHLAKNELHRALSEINSLEFPIVGLLAAAAGALTSTDLRALLKRAGRGAYVAEIETVLRTSLGRTVTHLPDPDGIDGDLHAFAHAALREAAQTKFERDLAEFEDNLLGWGDTFRAAGWPEDTPGYVLSHYPQHLVRANRQSDLFVLLEDDCWYQRHAQYDPSLSWYLTSVNHTWSAAEAINLQEIRDSEPPSRIGIEIRCALTTASVGSFSSSIGLSLFLALVRCGYWTELQAFRVARLNLDAMTRADSLGALADRLKEPLLTAAMREALAAAAVVDDEMSRAWILERLAVRMPGTLIGDALHLAQSIPLRLPDDRRPRVVALAALLARAAQVVDAGQALRSARALKNERDQAWVIAALASHLPPSLVPAVLDDVHKLTQSENRAEVLAGLALAPTGSSRDSLLRDAFDAAMSTTVAHEKSWILRKLAPHLPLAWIEEAHAAAHQELSNGNLWTLLAALAARLGQLQQWRRGLEVAREAEDDIWLVRSLVAVAPFVPKDERPAVSREILNAATAIQEPLYLPRELAEVAPHLSEPLLREALAFARDIPNLDQSAEAVGALLPQLAEFGHHQEAYELAVTMQKARRWRHSTPRLAQTMAALIPHLPEPLQSRACRDALNAARRIDDTGQRLLALALEAPHLSEDVHRAVLRSARDLNDGTETTILHLLARELPESLLMEALEVAYAMPAASRFGGVTLSSPRADALIALVPRLTEPMRSQALERACEDVAGIQNEVERTKASGLLASQLSVMPLVPEEVLRVAIDRVKAIGPGHGRPAAISMMAPYLPPAFVKEMAEKTRASDERSNQRVRSLIDDIDTTSGPPRLRTNHLYWALSEAKCIEDDDARAASLRILAPHLATLLRRQESEDQTEHEWRMSQAGILNALAPYLHLNQLPEALETALCMDQRFRNSILAALTPRLAQLPPADLYSFWQLTLHSIAPAHRSDLLQDLSALRSVVVALGGSQAVVSMVQAIEDIGSWWP